MHVLHFLPNPPPPHPPAVGETTFGKGRTQRIVRLQDDSLLFLSNAVYLTPKGDPVDRVGLRPDVVCQPQVRGWEGVRRVGKRGRV